MYKKLVIIFMIGNLWGTDFIDLYRKKGIKEVQKKFEESLTKTSYWDKYLENKSIKYGYYESKDYIIVTEKETKKMSLFQKKNNEFVLISNNDVILGENKGDKFIEGDKKTPVGAYDLTVKKDKLDQFYGPFAIVTSYPNTFDKSLNKNGYGIWIHGMPLNEKRELYTQGCIALDNNSLKQLDKDIKINKTVLLTSKGNFRKAKKEEISSILAFIFQWRDSWKISDIEKYLSFYSNEFKKKDGSGIEEFKLYKTRIFNKNEVKKIKFSNINILPYPNSLNKNMFRVIMDEEYYSPTVKFIGKKELYLELVNNQIKILSED